MKKNLILIASVFIMLLVLSFVNVGCDNEKITLEEYTVTFITDTEVNKVIVKEGDKVNKPTDSEKDGYIFIGWYTVNDEEYNFDNKVYSNITLISKFKKIEIKEEPVYYEVTFVTDNEETKVSVKEGDKVNKPTDPEKGGYIFMGWYIDNSLYDFNKLVTSNITLTAKFMYANPEKIEIETLEELNVGYNTKLKIEIYPEGTINDVDIYVQNEGVLQVDEQTGMISALRRGYATVIVTSIVNPDIKDEVFITVKDEVNYPTPDLKGYKIIIMNGLSALTDLDPFLDRYKMPDKSYRQQAWINVEKEFNCDLSVEAYPDIASWGDQRIKYIIDNAANGQSTADLCVISSDWLYHFANANAAVDVTDYYTKYGNQQMEAALKEAGSYKNKIYVASTGINKTSTYVDLGLYYDYKWVKDLGVKDPAEMFNNGEWNYTGFKDWALQVQAKLGEGEHAIGGHSYYYWLGMTNAAGVKVADTRIVSVNIDSQRSIDASNLMYSLTQSGAFDTNTTWAECDGGFVAGTTVMTTGFLWFRTFNRWSEREFGKDIEFGYVPFPYPDDLAKEDTRISQSGLSLLLYSAGREAGYPAGVTTEGIYQAVNQMYLDTIELQNADPTFDVEQTIYDSLSSELDNPASIKAIQWFTAARVFFDPADNIYSQSPLNPLITPAINVMTKGKDYQTEFAKAKESFETQFKKIYA